MPGACPRFSRAFSTSRLWSSERGERDPARLFGGGPVLDRQPEPLAPFSMCCCSGTASCCCPPFIDAVSRSHRGAPGPSDCEALRRLPGVYVPALYAPRLQQRRPAAGRRAASASGIPGPGWQRNHGEATPSATRWWITPEAPGPRIQHGGSGSQCPELCALACQLLTLRFPHPQPLMTP